MKNATLQAKHVLASLPIVAQALARRAKVEIVFDPRARTAGTDGKKIIMPDLPIPTSDAPNAALEKLAVLAYGYLDHEVGHVLYSDFGALKKAKPELHFLLNAIEDPRQEMQIIQTYPGTRRTMDALSIQLIKDDTQGVSDQQAPADLVAMTTHAWLRVALRREPAYEAIAEQGLDLIEAKLGSGVRSRLLALLAGPGMQMRDTSDALDLTRAIHKMLKEEAEKAKKDAERQEAQQQPQQGQQGQQGQGSPSGDPQQGQEGSGDSDPQDGAQGQGGGNGGDGQGQPPTAQGGSGSGSQSDSESSSGACNSGSGGNTAAQAKQRAEALQAAADGTDAKGFEDRGKTVLKEMAEAADEIMSSGSYFYAEGDSVGGSDTLGRPQGGGPLDTRKADEASAKLRRQLNVLLEAKSRAYTRIRDEGQHLSLRHLSNIAVQDARVFSHRSQVRRVDTAVLVLSDCSGSMDGAKIEVANGGLYAACKALEALRGVKVAAMAFPGNGLVKSFDQPTQSVLDRFRVRAWGGTPLTAALHPAARMLALRREPRKILIVLTDGAPDNRDSAKAVINALPGLGIEAYGIGIQHSAVTKLFGESRVVMSLDELPDAIFGLLRKQLAA